MSDDTLGNYRYAYPMYPPAPPAPPPQQSNGSDLAAMLIPVLLTIPALKTAGTNIAAIGQRLAALNLPPDVVGGNPTALDYNNLKNFAGSVRAELLQSVNNDQAAFSAMSRGLLLGLIIPAMMNGNANGNNGLMLVVLLLALQGGLGF